MENSERPLSWTEVCKAVLYFIHKDKSKYLVLIVLLVVVQFYYLLPPFLLGKTVDFFSRYKPGQDLSYFYFLLILLASTAIIAAIVRLLAKGSVSKLGVNARYRAKTWGFDKLTELSLEWHQQENTGNKIERILTGSKAVERMMKMFSTNILIVAVTFIGTALTTALINPGFIVFFVSYFIIILSIEIFFDRKITKLLAEYNKQQENASGTFIEGASNMLAIKALGAKDTLSKKVVEREDAAKLITYRRIRLSNYKWITFHITLSIAGSLFLWMTANEVILGRITAGTIIMYWSYFFNFRDRVTDFAESINDLLEIRGEISRMMPIFTSTQYIKSGNKSFPSRWNKITLKNISFQYKSEAQAIQNLSLTVKKGERIGIAGHSGSGKSTLVKLLLGLYEVQNGSITIGKENLYDISHEELTKKFAIVLQETELFNLSLKENVTMMRAVNHDLLKKSLTIAQLESVIEKLPSGIDTHIGEKGYALSGGERQRIGIARAIYKDAPILLLDEATSALDSQTEEKIMRSIYDELSKEKTMIIIAHRIATLRQTDRVIVFNQGQIHEEGKFEQLCLDTNSLFYKMYTAQSAIS